MKFFNKEVRKIIKKTVLDLSAKNCFFQEYYINTKTDIFYFTKTIDRKGRIWEGVRERRSNLSEKV